MKNPIIQVVLTVLFLCSGNSHGSGNGPVYDGLEDVLICFERLGMSEAKRTSIRKILSEDKGRPIPVLKQKDLRNFGSNKPQITFLNGTMLNLINMLFSEGRIPVCYDLGAGFGEISRNMVLAGGKVTYIEQNHDVAQRAHKEVYPALECVGKELKRRLRMIAGDALSLNSQKIYPKGLQIEICYMGDFLHFLTPKQIEEFLPGFLKKMVPKGMVYASFQSPALSGPKVVDFFFDQKERGNLYPGYFRVTFIKKIIFNETGDQIEDAVDQTATFATYASLGDLPGTIIEPEILGKAFPTGSHFGQTEVVHFFDPDSARSAFERAGFKVLNVGYMDEYGERIKKPVTRSMLNKNHYSVFLIAHK